MRQALILLVLWVGLASTLSAEEGILRLKSELDRVIPPAVQSKVAYCITDLSTGQSIGANEKNKVNPASVIKVAVMVETFAQAARGRFKLSDKLVLTKAHKVWGAGPLYSQPDGRAFPIQYLVECMIHYSDNTATKMLVDHLGKANINMTMRKLGLTQTVIGNSDLLKAEGLNYSTPQDMTLLLVKIFKGEVVSKVACQEMVLILSQQKYRWGIPKPAAKSVVVANKTGTLTGIKHDAGIVFNQKHPYAISIFTSQISNVYTAMQLITKMSETAYAWSQTM